MPVPGRIVQIVERPMILSHAPEGVHVRRGAKLKVVAKAVESEFEGIEADAHDATLCIAGCNWKLVDERA